MARGGAAVGGEAGLAARTHSLDFRGGSITSSYGTFATGFVMARTCSMKSCAAPLSVRFFNVVIAIGIRVSGNSTGKTRSEGRRRGSLSWKLERIARKRPVESSSLRRLMDTVETVSRGAARPSARKTSA